MRTDFKTVRDEKGNEFVCAADAIKDFSQADTSKLRESCVEDATSPQPYAGG